MSVVFVPGFLWTPGDEAALVQAGLSLEVVPLTTLARAVVDVDRDLVPALAARIDEADVVVGYSMGARVLLAALSRGLRAHAAVLLSLSSTPMAERAVRARSDAERAAWLVRDRAAFVDAWGMLAMFADATRQPAWQAQQKRRRALGFDEAVAHAETLSRFSSGTLTSDALDVVAVPVTLVAGARDGEAVALATQTATALSRGRVEVVQGSGHVLPLEAPDVVAQIVNDVVKTAPRSLSRSPRRTDVASSRS
jgi:pimeloyl-ACP methyl ester carboxylesterase